MIKAFIMIKTGGTGTSDSVTKSDIEMVKGIIDMHPVFGRYDLIVQVEVGELPHLSDTLDVLRDIPGVISTETLIVETT